MKPNVTIVEVLGRSEQGMTRPFLCRGDNDVLYYVKGRYAGLRSLCCEWIGSNLAQAMGLPIPEFTIAEVPAALVSGSDREDIRELGTGLVFASEKLEEAREITWTEAQACSRELTALVLLFDWWLHNEDRSLSPSGGNPNLLMTGEEGVSRMWVFDFNLVFDTGFSDARFRDSHLFSGLMREWPWRFRQVMEPRLKAALDGLNGWFVSLPKEWLYLDGDEMLPMELDKNLVFAILTRAFTEPDLFWHRP